MSLFHEGGRGQEKTTLSLLKNVTISLGGVGVKVNLDNVTNFTGFFFEGVPKSFQELCQLNYFRAQLDIR